MFAIVHRATVCAKTLNEGLLRARANKVRVSIAWDAH
jgi:hypothetical protein